MTEQRLRLPVPRPLVAVAVAGTLLGLTPVTPSSPAASRAPSVLGTKLTAPTGATPGNGKNAVKPDDKVNGNDKKDFTIAGSVSGLYPGSARTLTVTVTNPNNFAIRVTSLTATVADPAGPCTAGAVQVPPMAGTFVVPGNGSAATTLTARMANNPPDACQSTTFGITYSGTADKA